MDNETREVARQLIYAGRRFRVLVVEDDPSDADMLISQLSDLSIHAIEVNSGSEAVALLKTQCFDLAIVDLNLMGMNGTSVLSQARGRCPFVVMTGMTQSIVATDALALGAKFVLHKHGVLTPLDIGILLGILSSSASCQAIPWHEKYAPTLGKLIRAILRLP